MMTATEADVLMHNALGRFRTDDHSHFVPQIIQDTASLNQHVRAAGRNAYTDADTPGEWLKHNVALMEAFKEVMEHFAAQLNMDPYATKPLHKSIFEAIITQGMQQAMGAK